MSRLDFLRHMARQLAPFAAIAAAAIAVGVVAYLAPLLFLVLTGVVLAIAAGGALVVWLTDEWRAWVERRR